MIEDKRYLGKKLLERGFRQWFLYLFKIVNGSEWKELPIHKKMFRQIKNIVDGKTIRLAMNLCPRSGKCFGKGTLVRMYDGSVKCVEDIVVGDVVMGDDETPRTVLGLGRGREEMFRVTHEDGSSFVCNKSHLLVLRNTTNERNMEWGRTKRTYVGTEKIISVGDYINSTQNFKKRNKAVKASCDYCDKDLLLDPYMLGVWLGDGETNGTKIANMDSEVISYLYEWALKHSCRVTVYPQKRTVCNVYDIVGVSKRVI